MTTKEQISAILSNLMFKADIDDAVGALCGFGEIKYCDEGIDNGIYDEDCEDEYLMYMSYDLGKYHIKLYYGNNSFLFTDFDIR